MFGSVLLDVAIGVVLTFLLVSLIASTVTEAISAVLDLRPRTLRSSVQALLNDPEFKGLARDLYNDALISPFGTGTATTVAELVRAPAYIEPRQFGAALVELLHANAGAAQQSLTEAIADPQLRRMIQALDARATRAGTRLSDELAAWFEESMDRVSGWYKRRVQLISFLVALVLAVILNADIIRIATALWNRPVVAARVAGLPYGQQPDLHGLLQELQQQNSLIGWTLPPGGPGPDGAAIAGPTLVWLHLALRLLGWSITAAATLFGAPFWFDLLQRFVQVRSTGARPDQRVV